MGERGRKDVLKLARYLGKNEIPPELMITSTASRALYTALAIADEWKYPEQDIRLTKKLFHATVEEMTDLIQRFKGNSVAMFGHNPGLTDLVNHFTGGGLDNLPTCGVVALEFDISNWTEIGPGKGRQVLWLTPKKLQG